MQPAAALCGDCSCQAPVRPSAEASPIYQAAAAAAAASFEQRCCGCCVAKLQLAGLLPRTPAAGAAVGAGAPPPPACCGGGSGRRRVAAGAARLQSVRVQLPVQQPGAQGAALLPGLLHLNIQRSAYTAPRGTPVVLLCPEAASCLCRCLPPAAAGAACCPAALLSAAALHCTPSLLPASTAAAPRAQPAPAQAPGLATTPHRCLAPPGPALAGARVLVVSSPSVHAELLGLSERGALPPDLLDQLGLVHEWLGQPGKMQYSLVEATAGRLLFWAVGAGLPATAGLLLSVLQAPCGTSSAAAAGVLQRALQPSAAGAAAAGALAGMDGLSQLHLSMQATSAAAMQRAAEVRGARLVDGGWRWLCCEVVLGGSPPAPSLSTLPALPLLLTPCPTAGLPRRPVAAAPSGSVGLRRHAESGAGLGRGGGQSLALRPGRCAHALM